MLTKLHCLNNSDRNMVSGIIIAQIYTPIGISFGSAIVAGLTLVTNMHTDAQSIILHV